MSEGRRYASKQGARRAAQAMCRRLLCAPDYQAIEGSDFTIIADEDITDRYGRASFHYKLQSVASEAQHALAAAPTPVRDHIVRALNKFQDPVEIWDVATEVKRICGVLLPLSKLKHELMLLNSLGLAHSEDAPPADWRSGLTEKIWSKKSES